LAVVRGHGLKGLVLAGLALAFAAAPAHAGTSGFVVNSTGDADDGVVGDGFCDTAAAGQQCTLRAAIQEANNSAGGHDVDFNIPGPGVKTITPNTELPTITEPLHIDGYSQHGAQPNTRPLRRPDDAVLRIQLSGRDLPQDSQMEGLRIAETAPGTLIQGLVINRFPSSAVDFRADGLLRGSFIGTNPAGTKARGNGNDAVYVNQLVQAQIGGSNRAYRNVISGNEGYGIFSQGIALVYGNFIGTQADGRSPLGNGYSGVGMSYGSNRIGDNGEDANVIAFNENDGISDLSNGVPGNMFSRNRIFANQDLGIDLNDDGVTPNDPGDADTGPNSLLNFPVLHEAIHRPDRTVIKGTLRTYPAIAPYDVEFFVNPPGGEQGKKYIGHLLLMTDTSGVADFTFRYDKPVTVGKTITATTTDDGAETSEFSKPRRVKKP
jgi:CSLREA domain-containing protein